MYIQRYHDIKISNTGVWRVLDRLSSLLAKRRCKRCKKLQPGYQVQTDVKSVASVAGVAPKCTFSSQRSTTASRIRVLRVYPKCSQRTSIPQPPTSVAHLGCEQKSGHLQVARLALVKGCRG